MLITLWIWEWILLNGWYINMLKMWFSYVLTLSYSMWKQVLWFYWVWKLLLTSSKTFDLHIFHTKCRILFVSSFLSSTFSDFFSHWFVDIVLGCDEYCKLHVYFYPWEFLNGVVYIDDVWFYRSACFCFFNSLLENT